MSDLAKLVSDIRRLTRAEAVQLIGLLEPHRTAGTAPADKPLADAADDVTTLSEEDWLAAEAISLKTEAAALSRSLDDTLSYVESRCRVILEAERRPGSKQSRKPPISGRHSSRSRIWKLVRGN